MNVLQDQAKRIRTLEAEKFLLQLALRDKDRAIARRDAEIEALKQEIRRAA